LARSALFTGLIYDEYGNLLETAFVGSEAQYVINDQGFLRHVDSELIDRQVLTVFLSELEQNKDLAIDQALNLIGKDDLFTKAAVDASMRDIDMDDILVRGIPEQARNMMGMLGFRVLVNVHGEVVSMKQPMAPEEED